MSTSQPLQVPLLDKEPVSKDFKYIYYNNIAIFISTISFFYNIIEGAVSIYFGEVTDSLSLFFFGVQSLVEVLSSVIVLWKVMTSYAEDKTQIRKEKIATIFIGCLFIFLTIGIFITGILSLIRHDSPTTTIPNIIVSASATTIMMFLYLTKKKLARELNSSTIQSDAQCSLACIRITILLLLGSIVYHFWEGGWWIDGAIALILGVLFGKEGVTMLIWAQSKNFSGGCCGGCAKMPESSKPALSKVTDTTTLKNEYQKLDNAEEDIEAKVSAAKVVSGGGCCKSGKCSKKEENVQSAPNPGPTAFTTIVINENEGMNLKANESAVPQKAAGGCCKSGKCSKKAEDVNANVVIQVDPPVVPKQESSNAVEDKPAPPKAAGGCCKSGSCSKKAEVVQAQPAEVILNVPAVENIVPEVESQPPKKAGGCCKSGKCSKKAENEQAAPVENNTQTTFQQIDTNQDFVSAPPYVTIKDEVMPPKSGGCCKGGKCSKKEKEESVQSTPTLADSLATTSTNVESEVIVVPQKAAGGCCKNGVCSKKTQPAVLELNEASA